MNTADPIESNRNDLADTNTKKVYTGLIVCVLIIIALGATLLFNMNREKPVQISAQLTSEINLMKRFFAHLDQIAKKINDQKGWIPREEFSVEVYRHFELLKSKDPEMAAIGLNLWGNKMDLWGNDLVIQHRPVNNSGAFDEEVRVVISSMGPPGLDDWNEKVVFTTKYW